MVQPATFLRRLEIDSRARRKQPTLISLFSGCGGAALGIRQAGFEVRVFVEFDETCCETLAANWIKPPRGAPKSERRPWHQRRDPVIMRADLTKLSTAEILAAAELAIGEADCLEGGFPCQGFSTSGKRMIDDPRNRLYRECVRVIGEALPRFFVLENVPGLISMGGGTVMCQICEDLAEVGYDVQWDILNAADFGVPQNRKRVFILGHRVDHMHIAGKRVQLFMGAAPGAIYHPEFFLKRLEKIR